MDMHPRTVRSAHSPQAECSHSVHIVKDLAPKETYSLHVNGEHLYRFDTLPEAEIVMANLLRGLWKGAK